MSLVIFPGSFDPITLGHEDLIRRAARMFDRVVVAMGQNVSKHYLFNEQQRLNLLITAVKSLKNVEVVSWAGLVSDLAIQYRADGIIKGIRTVQDLESETVQAQANRKLSGIETVFLPTSPEFSFLSSSVVKEIAFYGGKLEGMVNREVSQALREAYSQADAQVHTVDPE